MAHSATHPRASDDFQLWLTAFLLSSFLSFLVLLGGGLLFTTWSWFVVDYEPAEPSKPESMATIYIEAPAPEEVSKMLEASKPKFARTTDDQVAPKREEKSEFIGERNTQATSDRAPDQSAPLMPSQKGIEEDRPIETTESRFQDGEIADVITEPSSSSLPQEVSSDVNPAKVETVGQTDLTKPGDAIEEVVAPIREKLLEGPNPVDVQVPIEEGVNENIKVKPEQPKVQQSLPKPKVVEEAIPKEEPKSKTFSGFQRKTSIVGSISRTGKSALNVDDTAMGRYQATVSKVVEREWQRNCVRHRDFITPGFLTVKFFLDTDGRVKSCEFVGEMETSEIQKGFTLSSIRDAEIPEMPDELKKAYQDESLELVFRFYF